MTAQSIILLVVFLTGLLALAYPLGIYLEKVGENSPIRGWGWISKLENLLYRLAGITPDSGMHWKSYALALLAFNVLGALFVYALQRLQAWLPLNPQAFPNVSPDSAFNTAVSFVSNTNWQGYSGESSISYLTQILALTGQNFFSAATGIAVAFALIRGFSSRSAKSIGNFWVDITRSTLYLLLPISAMFAVFLMSQGVIQNFSAYKDVNLIDPITYSQPKNGPDGQPLKDANGNPVLETLTAKTQTLAMGPVASQEAIKMLGTNGGGFFNANSAHPYENPTPLSNFMQMLSIFLIPAGLCFAFGRMVGDIRQGWAVLGAMTIIFVVMTAVVMSAEQQVHPALQALGVDQAASVLQSGGNMEGKETRFGISASALFAAVTTAASCGAVNAMHDSFMPLGGMVPLVLIQFGEVVFIVGLMIGRTPEYLGKKIQSYEMKMTSIAILVTPLLVLAGTAIAVMLEPGKAGIANPGAHGFSEILYALSSAANNNGSAFAGLSANTPFYNGMLAIAMWFGRFAVIVPILAVAGSLAMSRSTSSPQEHEFAVALHDEALRMSNLVTNLLDMARIQSGEVRLNLEWQPFEEVVGSALRASQSFLARHEVQTRLARDLPLIQFDAILIERVLCNLLENASKYTPPGSRIVIAAEVSGQYLAAAVYDNGPGLPSGKEEAILKSSPAANASRRHPASVWGWRFAAPSSRRTAAPSVPDSRRKAAHPSCLRCRSARLPPCRPWTRPMNLSSNTDHE